MISKKYPYAENIKNAPDRSGIPLGETLSLVRSIIEAKEKSS